jgi:hypothetical protein
MSSVRDLKKNIDSLIFEVISDSFIYSRVHPDKKPDEVSTVINDAVNLRNDLIARVNNPDGMHNPKILKAYYRSVEKDLIEGADKLFKRLIALQENK